MWCGVVLCDVVWCGVVWCGVVWCCVVMCGVVWCGVVWCGLGWCGVVWCGVVWGGVVHIYLATTIATTIEQGCDHNLSKPEFNPSTIKFKIQLVAMSTIFLYLLFSLLFRI